MNKDNLSIAIVVNNKGFKKLRLIKAKESNDGRMRRNKSEALVKAVFGNN